jgi:hypothetical protein
LLAVALSGVASAPGIAPFDRRGWSDNDVCAYSEFGIGDADIGSRLTDNFIDAIYTIPDASGDVVGYVYHGSKGTFGLQGNEFMSPAMLKSLNLHMDRFWSNEIRLSVAQAASLNPRPCSLRERLHVRSRYVFYDAVARAFQARRLRKAEKS